MRSNKITPEQFSTYVVALGWDPDRTWLLRCLMVAGARYEAMAAFTGRTETALRSVVKRARKEILEYETAQREAVQEPEAETVMQHAAVLHYLLDYHVSFDTCLAAIRIIDGFWKNSERLTAEQQRARNLELIAYKYARDLQYALGTAPPP